MFDFKEQLLAIECEVHIFDWYKFNSSSGFWQVTSEVGKMGSNLEVYFNSIMKKYMPNYLEPSSEPKSKRKKDDAKMYILNQ